MRSLVFLFCLFFGFAGFASEQTQVKKLQWSFEGILGYYDKASLQRGFKVYNEVCSSCHSMNLLTYRKLKDIGFSENEVKTLAAAKTVLDGPNDNGEMFERPARPQDKFVDPYLNKNAAMFANGGAYPPDLSLIVKSRAHQGGANYVYSLLTGFENAPQNFAMPDGKYYNKYFSGNIISMSPPLSDGLISYTDGTENSADQMARDVSNFLQWASEPELEKRKQMGAEFMVFFVFATIVCLILKRKIWKNIK